MIRKVFMLVIVSVLFLYVVFNFFVRAVMYDPLSGAAVREPAEGAREVLESYSFVPAWSPDIYEKNLFSPGRTYEEPKAVVEQPAAPPPKRPEITLKGIILDLYGEYVAYIEIDNQKAVSMRKGDITNDVEVVNISEREVMLKWNDESIHLSMGKIKTINRPRENR